MRDTTQISGGSKFEKNVRFALTYLGQATLVEKARRGTWGITDLGREWAVTHAVLTTKDLKEIPAFAEWRTNHKSRSKPLGRRYHESEGAALGSATDQRRLMEFDPEKLERGIRGHEETLRDLAKYLREQGLKPREPSNTEPEYDLAWRKQRVDFVAEVKSTTPGNESRQLRLGLGQVLWYRCLLAQNGRQVVAALVPEHAPGDPVWIRLCEELDVLIAWPGAFERLLT